MHGGYEPVKHEDALTPPIFQTSTFVFPNAEAGEARFAGESEGYVYTRLGNPTVTVLEERMAQLEGAEAALAFGSGMAAVSAVLIGLVKSGDHIICSEGLYGCTFGLLTLLRDKFNVQFTLVDTSDVRNIEQALKPETKVLYIETPINPTIKLVDLKAVTNLAKANDLTTVVDNTFSSPYIQRPIEVGCDVVIHSATKYISGHGDVIAGIACGTKELMGEIRMHTLKDIGGVIGPFDAWLLIRGIKTLGIRMEKHSESALKVAQFLEQHKRVKKVYYPGLESFEQHELAQQQMRLPGGILSFDIEGGKKEAQAFLNALEMVQIAVSLGDAESLAQHPATMTHAIVPEEDRLKMGITDSLIRLSVGLEEAEDIMNDLQQALDKAL